MTPNPEIRHRFEPARLLLGLGLLGVAVVCLAAARDGLHISVWAVLAVLAMVLLVSSCTAVITLVVRGRRERRRERASRREESAGQPPR